MCTLALICPRRYEQVNNQLLHNTILPSISMMVQKYELSSPGNVLQIISWLLKLALHQLNCVFGNNFTSINHPFPSSQKLLAITIGFNTITIKRSSTMTSQGGLAKSVSAPRSTFSTFTSTDPPHTRTTLTNNELMNFLDCCPLTPKAIKVSTHNFHSDHFQIRRQNKIISCLCLDKIPVNGYLIVNLLFWCTDQSWGTDNQHNTCMLLWLNNQS